MSAKKWNEVRIRGTIFRYKLHRMMLSGGGYTRIIENSRGPTLPTEQIRVNFDRRFVIHKIHEELKPLFGFKREVMEKVLQDVLDKEYGVNEAD